MIILVAGATGTVGRHLVDQLLRAGHKVRALTRNPDRANLPDGAETVAGDLTDATSLEAAFDGVTAAHLINFGDGYRPLANGQKIVELALRSGIGRVTVLGGWEEGTLDEAVRGSTLQWSALKPIEFMSNTLADWGEPLRTEGVIREPYGDRRSAPVHEADIAAVAAVALTEDGHAGEIYPITGPEVLTPRDKIRILGEATGRDFHFEELTPDQTRRQWTANPQNRKLFEIFGDSPEVGYPQKVEFMLQMFADIPEVGYTVTDTVEKVTGRPAYTFARWAAEHADAFTGKSVAPLTPAML